MLASLAMSTDWKPSDQRQWYATGSVSANATTPTSRCASPSHAGVVRGTWIFSYMRSASSTCTTAKRAATAANQTFSWIVSVKKSEYGFSRVGVWSFA